MAEIANFTRYSLQWRYETLSFTTSPDRPGPFRMFHLPYSIHLISGSPDALRYKNSIRPHLAGFGANS